MDSYLGLSNVLRLVDAAIQNSMQTTYGALSGALSTTLQLLLILYVAYFGVGHLTGRLPFDLWKTARHFIVMVVITSLVTRWDIFALYVGNLFTEGPNKLIGIISGGTSDPNHLLGDVMDRGIQAANTINQMAGWSTFGFLIAGYSVFYMTLWCVGYSLYLLVLSKLALAILLGLAPLFFLFFLFEKTEVFVTHYIRQLFNFALIPVFTSAVLGVMLKIPQQALIDLQTVLASHNGHGGRACFFVLLSFFILSVLLLQVTGFASGLSGGGFHLHPGSASSFALGMAVSNLRPLGKRGKSSLGTLGKWALIPFRPRQRQTTPPANTKQSEKSASQSSTSDHSGNGVVS